MPHETPGFTAEPIGPDAEAEKKRAERQKALNESAPYVSDLLGPALATMQARASGKEKPVPLPWPSATKALGGGLWPGLHVLTGATGQGKTQFALQAAWAAAGAGVPVLYVGLELGPVDLAARLLALAIGEAEGRTQKWNELFLGKAPPEVAEKLGRYADAVAAKPIRAEFGPPLGWSYEALYERVRALREEFPDSSIPVLVVLDYLQAVGAPHGARLDVRERIREAAYAARAAARDFNASVLMLSSVARENVAKLKAGADKADTRPGETSAADLVGLGKESGEIEYAADSVLALVSGEWTEGSAARPMWLALAKMRAGQPAWCALEFNGSTFSEPRAVARSGGGFSA